MNDTIWGVIIGALIGVVPNVVNAFFAHRESQRQREHEIHLKRFELIEIPRINAILSYCESIGKCLSIPGGKLDTPEKHATYADYLSPYERVYPYVSANTRLAMEQIGDPLNCDVSDKDISHLNSCLGAELRNAVDDTGDPARGANHL